MDIFFKKNYFNFFNVWLITLIILLIVMIVVGGLTRLTDSGLSITKWQLFSGIFPPISNEDWNHYFNLYKEIPEFKLQNYSMNMEEFKIIFWWEWAHRFLGRVIGLTFILPLIYFSYKLGFKKVLSLYSVFILVCAQGLIGWYMVSSGLVDRVDVSHYRLSIHLFMAFLILSSLVWYYLNHKNTLSKNFFINSSKLYSIKFFIFLIFLQIIIGAFVSGLDAGKIYQTWPLMNESYFPDDLNLNNYKEFLNFDDRSVVQFAHRNVAYLIFLIIVYIGFNIRRLKKSNLYNSYYYLLLFILIQLILGVLALITNLHIAVASMHQISSIFLIILSLNFYYKSIN